MSCEARAAGKPADTAALSGSPGRGRWRSGRSPASLPTAGRGGGGAVWPGPGRRPGVRLGASLGCPPRRPARALPAADAPGRADRRPRSGPSRSSASSAWSGCCRSRWRRSRSSACSAPSARCSSSGSPASRGGRRGGWRSSAPPRPRRPAGRAVRPANSSVPSSATSASTAARLRHPSDPSAPDRQCLGSWRRPLSATNSTCSWSRSTVPRMGFFNEMEATCSHLEVRVSELSAFYEHAFGHVPAARDQRRLVPVGDAPPLLAADADLQARASISPSPRSLSLVAVPIVAILALLLKLGAAPPSTGRPGSARAASRFQILKLRSMHVTHRRQPARWSAADDERVTSARPLHAPHPPRRAAAVAQRAQRRDEHRRPAPGAAELRRGAWRSRSPSTAAATWCGRESPAGRRSAAATPARTRARSGSSATTSTTSSIARSPSTC